MMTTENNPAPNWLIYCRPGFERDCVEETQAKPIETVENSAFVVLQGKPRLAFGQLAFARQLISLHGEIKQLPERDRITPLLSAIPVTPEKFGCLYLEVPDSNEGKTLSGFTRRFQPLLEEKLRAAGRLVDDPALPRLHLFFPDKNRVLIGSSDPQNSSRSLNGIQRVSMTHDAPSRSYLKLAEAFEVFLDKSQQALWLKPGMTAIDLGAAPGGWTWQLVQRGLKVTAVDNGPLKGAAVDHPLIKHMRKDGFSFRPQRPVDWLVCDMVEQPQRVATLVTEWFINGHTRHAVFNLKLPMKKRVTSLHSALDSIHNALNAKGIRHHLDCKQLYHDREEVTVFLARIQK
ncbi:MAG: 23S rRNA (cytidine(2498)-2'-O)-methyltransferase RlmM [Gallionellaceae bacterium]|jgi:23S rRNA (cytidine2498-2'-O)-methyltransferase